MFDLEKEVRVEAGGKTWTLGKWTVGMTLDLRDWVKEVMGDPFEALDKYIDRLPPDEAMKELQEAKSIQRQLRNFTLECPLAREILKQTSGLLKLVHLRMLTHHPEATADDAFALAMAEGGRIVAKKAAEKKPPPPVEAEAGNPPPPPG